MVWTDTCDHHPYRAGKPARLYLQALQSPAGYYAGFWCPVCGPIRRISGYYKTVAELCTDWHHCVNNLIEIDLYNTPLALYKPITGGTECYRREIA
jgi:hypothetical protein